MWTRFASAAAVASVIITLAVAGLRLSGVQGPEARELIVSIWCVLPMAWGVWAMLAPSAWVPLRLPAWGALLGFMAGVVALFVLDVPARLGGESFPAWASVAGVILAVVIYYVLWRIVQRGYEALAESGVTR